MTDVILGMGEVGKTIFELLSERGFNCIGIDRDKSKCQNYSDEFIVENPEYLHVCIPGYLLDFNAIVNLWLEKFNSIRGIIIHSTVKPGTTKTLQAKITKPVFFSPVRGVHTRFLEDLKRYTKFFSSEKETNSEIKLDIQKRFQKVEWLSTTKTAELAKLLVDTTYYGWLINYAQITKIICEKEKVDFDEMWKFADEIHENLGNRPKMFPGVIGGHCVIPNLDLIENKNLETIKKINDMYKIFNDKFNQ